MFITKSFLNGERWGEDEPPSFKRMPIIVVLNTHEKRLLGALSFNGASRDDINVAGRQSPTQSIRPLQATAAQVIPAASTNQSGRAENKILAPRLRSVDQADSLTIKTRGEDLAGRSHRDRCRERQVVAARGERGRGKGISRKVLRAQKQGEGDRRIDHARRRVEMLTRNKPPLGILPVTRQQSCEPPIRDQAARRTLGHAQKTPDILRAQMPAPKQHRLGKTAGNVPAKLHLGYKSVSTVQYSHIEFSLDSVNINRDAKRNGETE